MDQAFSAAKTLSEAYLAAKAAEEAKRSGGSGTARKQETSEAKVKSSLAQAVATARGQLQANPNGAAFYANGDRETVDRVVKSDLPKYVKLRGEMNGTYTAKEFNKLRQNTMR